MIDNKTIAVVVPAYNEEKQIRMVIETMPDFVDRIIVVNDNSTDKTAEVIISYIESNINRTKPLNQSVCYENKSIFDRANQVLKEQNDAEIEHFPASEVYTGDKAINSRIILINLLTNQGVGAAISRGYKWCKDHKIDCTAVMAGDGQMDPAELHSICKPVIHENIDYVKGNRLIHRSAWLVIPKIRYFGNSILSILTKIASGYWHVSDTQTGYTAISLKALEAIRIYNIYKRFGMPNDLLVKLNIAFCTIKEIEIKPVYDIGEQSKMKIFRLILPISWLLFRSFFKRLWVKYLFRDFHPLFFLYNLGILLGISTIPFFIKTLNYVILGQNVNPVTFLAFIFLFISSFQSLLFAMWMDIQDNDRLYK